MLGSFASTLMSGLALASCAVVVATSCSGRNSSPSCSKSGPPAGSDTWPMRPASVSRRKPSASASAAAPANSGAGASTTARIVWLRCGNASSIARPSAAHFGSFSTSLLMSVLILKWCAT
ncbi:Uncharacterised protein [Burkholderia pseudomallei]|nr:Uncharacterised protein [Burkholderia pseudomallei]